MWAICVVEGAVEDGKQFGSSDGTQGDKEGGGGMSSGPAASFFLIFFRTQLRSPMVNRAPLGAPVDVVSSRFGGDSICA